MSQKRSDFTPGKAAYPRTRSSPADGEWEIEQRVTINDLLDVQLPATTSQGVTPALRQKPMTPPSHDPLAFTSDPLSRGFLR